MGGNGVAILQHNKKKPLSRYIWGWGGTIMRLAWRVVIDESADTSLNTPMDMIKQKTTALVVLALIMWISPASVAQAQEPASTTSYGPYYFEVNKVYDGDTFDVRIWSFPKIVQTERVRLLGVDTPELRGKCASEKALAKRAKAFVVAWLAQHQGQLRLHNVKGKPDSFGRLLADVRADDGGSLGDDLLAQGLARVYVKGQARNWCKQKQASLR